MTVIEPRPAGVFDSVAGAIGNTPLVRLNRVTEGIAAAVYVKLEYLNPGGSVKDRAALSMLEAAEVSGELGSGGTVVEASSGNTGIGLAAVAVARGYRTIVVVPDKSSAEKIALLRAYGVEVHVTAGGRPVGHPEHIRSVALRLAEEIPGAWFAGQYDNPANPAAHYATTGPEIWAQTGGRVTHYVAGVGTGGTITGAGEFLKEVSGGAVRVVGADPESSVYGGGDGRAWYIESVGHYLHPQTEEDLWPTSYHPEVADAIERIPDAEALTLLHRLAREEGLLLGGSSGTSIAAALRVARSLGPDGVVVVIAPDSGRSYLSKYFDDEWLGRLGFPLLSPVHGPTVGYVLHGVERDETAGAVPSWHVLGEPAAPARNSVRSAVAGPDASGSAVAESDSVGTAVSERDSGGSAGSGADPAGSAVRGPDSAGVVPGSTGRAVSGPDSTGSTAAGRNSVGTTVGLDAGVPAVPSDVSVARARELLGDSAVLPVLLARPAGGSVVVAEVLGVASAATLAAAPGEDPVTAHLDPPLPVVGVTEGVVSAARRVGEYTGPVLVARAGVAVALLDSARIVSAAGSGSTDPGVTEAAIGEGGA